MDKSELLLEKVYPACPACPVRRYDCIRVVERRTENGNWEPEKGMNRKIEKFEDIEVWKDGMNLTVELYKLLSGCRDFGFRDQLQRAAVSIPSNIAEGYERNTNKEYIQFLYIAKGSCGELRTQLYLAEKLGYITSENANQLINKTRKISSMLYNLIKTRKEKF